MQKNNIEKSGVKFKLNDNNTFADLTNLLQIIENENHKIFTFDFENDYLYVLKSNSDSDKIKTARQAIFFTTAASLVLNPAIP